jgi:hypothetical protein
LDRFGHSNILRYKKIWEFLIQAALFQEHTITLQALLLRLNTWLWLVGVGAEIQMMLVIKKLGVVAVVRADCLLPQDILSL